VPHKLLLADDSVTIQKVIELTFADEDIEVLAVGDGRQAIDLIPTERPDIVLADVGMPERDGYEVAAFVKGRPDLAHIPVLLLTGAFEPIDEGRATAAGCDGVLVKPFEPQMVITRVKDLIAGKRPVQGGAVQPRPSPHVAGPLAPAVPADEYFDRLDSVFSKRDPASPRREPVAPRAPEEVLTSPGVFPSETPEPPGPAPAVVALPPATRSEAPGEVQEMPSGAGPAPTPFGPPTPASPSPVAEATFADRPADQVENRTAATPVSPSASTPTLAEAFAALLAAEQGKVPPPPVNEQALRDDVVDEVTRRVIERMTDRAVRDVTLEVAERLVREEIDRIKTPPR